jgi:hypothetical protein
MMRQKMQLKEAAAKEREDRWQQVAKRKAEREASRSQREAEKLQKVADAFTAKAFKAKWSPEAVRDVGQGLWGRAPCNPAKKPLPCSRLSTSSLHPHSKALP